LERIRESSGEKLPVATILERGKNPVKDVINKERKKTGGKKKKRGGTPGKGHGRGKKIFGGLRKKNLGRLRRVRQIGTTQEKKNASKNGREAKSKSGEGFEGGSLKMVSVLSKKEITRKERLTRKENTSGGKPKMSRRGGKI